MSADKSQRIVLIVNPLAGNGTAVKELEEMVTAVEAEGFVSEVLLTHRPDHATQLARSCIGTAAILAVGGDGTLNEVVNGLVGKDIPLGFMPVGTGNDFAKALGIHNWRETVAALANNHTQLVDIAHIDLFDDDEVLVSRHFINMMGVGFDAAVAVEVQRRRFGSGVLPYLLAVLKMLRRYKSVPASVVFRNEELNTRMFLCSIGNGTTSGGGFVLTPSAVMDDGLLDLCYVRHVGITRVLSVLPKAMRGRHLKEAEVTTAQAAHFEIVLDIPTPVHIDGEILSRSARKIIVTVKPSALRMFRPNPSS